MKSAEPNKSSEPEAAALPLRVLIVEDSYNDTELIVNHLESSGFAVHHHRVYDRDTMEEALGRDAWDVVLCDYKLPSFDLVPALEILKKKKLDLPFIVVSGTVGENVAVEVMKAGAHDFIVKDKLNRLAPAINRELREAKVRVARAADIEKLIFLAAIVDSTGEAIMSLNLDGTITTWNSGAEQLFGYTAEEAVGNSIFMIVPERLRDDTQKILEQLRAGHPVENIETVRVRRDGAELQIYQTLSPIRGDDGHLMGAASIAYNITERKKIEDERTRMIQELNDTLSKVRTLSGLLPICASCKKIRDDQGYWQKLETFVHEHSNAEFSHSICPDCIERLYPDYAKPKQ